MRRKFGFALVSSILCWFGCVDRVFFDVGNQGVFPIVIEGFISDQPGPYEVRVNKAFDIESKLSTKTPLSVKRLVVSDNVGNSEELIQVSQGVYHTDSLGIRGVVGRAYTLHAELLDGRVYETVPDTLYASGMIDSVYHNFKSERINDGETNYGFDVLFNSSSGEDNNFRFLWKFTGTYQIDAYPELHTIRCGESMCPDPLPCSSYALNTAGELEYTKLCECCTCWVSFYNDNPIASDNQIVQGGSFNAVKIGYVPVTQWTFLHKVRVEVEQRSLSVQAFDFWRKIQAQKEGQGSLFQPVIGHIAGNFVQVSGKEGTVEGLFYATSIYRKSIYITRNDVPNQAIIPPQELPFKDSCLKFANSTTRMPDGWQ